MKKLNVILGLLLILLCAMLISADVTEHPEQRFEYAKMEYNMNGNGSIFSIIWNTENSSIATTKSIQDFLIQMSGESVTIGDIAQVKNEIGVINFLGDRGWELVSSYYIKGFLGDHTVVYVFKRLWSKYRLSEKEFEKKVEKI